MLILMQLPIDVSCFPFKVDQINCFFNVDAKYKRGCRSILTLIIKTKILWKSVLRYRKKKGGEAEEIKFFPGIQISKKDI